MEDGAQTLSVNCEEISCLFWLSNAFVCSICVCKELWERNNYGLELSARIGLCCSVRRIRSAIICLCGTDVHAQSCFLFVENMSIDCHWKHQETTTSMALICMQVLGIFWLLHLSFSPCVEQICYTFIVDKITKNHQQVWVWSLLLSDLFFGALKGTLGGIEPMQHVRRQPKANIWSVWAHVVISFWYLEQLFFCMKHL